MSDPVIDGHALTMTLDVHELARRLLRDLGATVVATLAGVRDRKLPYKWAEHDGPTPRAAALSRLQTAHRAWLLVSDADSPHVARAWFIGANPRLDEHSPVMELREGNLQGVLAAAKAWAAEGS